MEAVQELRLVLTVEDFDGALDFYRDALGLGELEMWKTESGRGVLLAAGNATLELVDEPQARAIDEIEVGHRVSGPVRIALQVADSEATAESLAGAGVQILADPVDTPWRHRNVRVQAPEDMQLTLFTVLDEA